MTLPAPQILKVDGYTVIDDHKIGTKYRMALALAAASTKKDFYYATTDSGDSPAALARACHEHGKNLVLFTPELHRDKTPTLRLAEQFNAKVDPQTGVTDYDPVYDIASKAARRDGAEFIDFDDQTAIDVLADIARSLNLSPQSVWSASAKGAMSRAYQLAWPDADHYAVAVMDYREADFGQAKVYRTDTPYRDPFEGPTAFPCNRNYEAKAWEFMKTHMEPNENVVFWNPAGPN